MCVLRILFGDRLSFDLTALADVDQGHDIVLMIEVDEENTYVRHHKQKIVLVLSAMRHFADAQRQRGMTVDYVKFARAFSTPSGLSRTNAGSKTSRSAITRRMGGWTGSGASRRRRAGSEGDGGLRLCRKDQLPSR